MVYRHTNFNPLTWWRPMAMTLGLLVLMGSSTEVLAQPCGISVSSADGTTTAPDGSTVSFIDFAPSLNSSGDAQLRRADINNRITSTGGCNSYLFFRADGTTSNNADRNFDCDDMPGGSTDATNRFYFVRIDDDGTVDNVNTSAFVGIKITSVTDNLGPQITVTPTNPSAINCDDSRNPYDAASPLALCTVNNVAGCTSFPTMADNCTSSADLLTTLTYVDQFVSAAGGTQTFNRVWTVTDKNGNTGTTSQQVTVQDQQDPIFVSTASVPLAVSATNNNAAPAYPRTNGAGNAVAPPTTFIYRTMENLSCGTALPSFTPVAIDYCQAISTAAPFPPQAAPPVINLTSTTFNPANAPNLAASNASKFNYDATQTFTATDNFGRTETATRRYEYRDQVAPVITSAQSSLGTPVKGNTTDIGNNAFDATYDIFEDEYTASGNIVVSANPNTCNTSINFSLAATDNCNTSPANLTYSYQVFEQVSGGGEVFSQGGNFVFGNTFTISGFQSGRMYRVRLMVTDVTGNRSYVDAPVEVLSVNPVITCTTSTIQVTLNTLGQGSISAAQVLGTIPTQPCGFNSLSYEIRDVADGAALASGMSSNANSATVNFDCSDVSGTRTIEVKVSNTNGGAVTCTRQVQVTSSSTTSLSSAATVVGSSAPGTADGQIIVTTSGSTGPFTYTYSGPTSGTATGGSPFTISGLLTGVYTVNVSTNNGCTNTTVSNIFVPVDDPIGLTAVCPAAFTSGTIAIPVNVSDFDNINSTEFTVTLGGGLTVTSAAPSNLPATTGVNIIGTNQVTFSWFLQNMNTNPAVTLANGTTILTINAQVPNTTGNYTVTIDGSQTQLSATQNQGSGSAASTPISVNATNCSSAIQSSPASVSGNINFFSPTGSGVNGVSIAVNASNNVINSTTNATGNYSVQTNPNSNVTVTPTRPHSSQTQLLDGVNGGDLVQIQRSILGLSNTLSGNAYKTIAADANGNNTVDGGDLVRIQRAILGLESSFAVPAWRFVQASQTFADPDSPFTGLQETYTNANLNSAVTVNFIGIKVGDVDCSATAPYKLTTEGGSEKATNADIDYRGVLPIQVKEQKLKAGELYEVKFTAQDFRDLLTYQTTIEFNTDALTFVDVTTNDALANLNEASFGLQRAAEGMITTLWYNATAQSLADGTEVFTLRFRANEENILSRVLRFTSNGIPQMAMGTDYETFNIDLNFENAIKPADKFDLNQNRPNPFGDETVITFELTEGSVATIAITDINGRVVRTYQQNFTPGYHEIKVNRTDVPSAGVYFYQLTTPTHQSAIRKMIVVD